VDGPLVGCCAWTAVEDDGAENLEADVLWESGEKLDSALRAAVGEDVQNSLSLAVTLRIFRSVGEQDMARWL